MIEDIGKETLRRIAGMPRFNRWLAEVMRPFLGERVIEVGSGSGTLTELLLPGRRAMLCLDVDRGHAIALQHRYHADPRVGVVEADAADPRWLEGQTGAWDSIVCANVLEHIADERAALRNMHAALAVSGRLVLYVPALPALYGSLDAHLGHRRRYDRRALLAMLSDIGFSPLVTRYVNLFGIFGWFLNGRILRRTILPATQLRLYDRLSGVFRFVEEALGPPIGQSLFLVAAKMPHNRS